MDLKNERMVALYVAFILLLIGVVCYAAYPGRSTEEPIRIMFKGTAGKVLFDMKEHTVEEGYGYLCEDCHHDYEEGAMPDGCGIEDCHTIEVEEEELLKRELAFHTLCWDCHEEDGVAPQEKECIRCHVL